MSHFIKKYAKYTVIFFPCGVITPKDNLTTALSLLLPTVSVLNLASCSQEPYGLSWGVPSLQH